MKLYLIIGLVYGTFIFIVSYAAGILKSENRDDLISWVIVLAMEYVLWPWSIYRNLKDIYELKVNNKSSK